MAITFTATADYGQTGHYIARILGRAPRVQFRREFLGRRSGKRNDISTALVDDPGLYEVVNATRKGKDRDYWILLEFEGQLRQVRSDEDDFMTIAKRLDGGETLEQIVVFESVAREAQELEKHPDWSKTRLVYTIRNKAEVKQAIAAVTIDTAVHAIVAALEPLPAKMQKDALAAAKARLFPKAEPAEPATPNPAFVPTHVITRNGAEIPIRKDHRNDCALYTADEWLGAEDVESHWEMTPDGALLFDGRTPMGVVTIRILD
jgi:hypothetical protein